MTVSMAVVLEPGEVRALNGVLVAALAADGFDEPGGHLDATERDALRALQAVLLAAQRPGCPVRRVQVSVHAPPD